MARRRRSSRRSRSMHMGAMHMRGMHMDRLGVLGSEPMSWGSLAVGAVVGYGLAMLVSRASQSSGPVSGFGAMPRLKPGPIFCGQYSNAPGCRPRQ